MNEITERQLYHLVPLNQVCVFQQTKKLFLKLRMHYHYYNYQIIPYHEVFVKSFSQLFESGPLQQIV